MILFWLLPPLVVTVTAMVVVSWLGRDGRGEVDPEVALRRMGRALEPRTDRLRRRRTRPGYVVVPNVHDRSTGVALRDRRAS